jgi:hypothetical protein
MSSSRPAPSQAYSDSTPCRDTPLNEWRPPRFPHCLRPNSHRKTVTETNLATKPPTDVAREAVGPAEEHRAAVIERPCVDGVQ